MLPNAYHYPSLLPEFHVGVGIPPTVRLDLISPPVCVLFRPRAVLRTAVPEAPVDEDRDSLAGEGDVGATTEVRQGVVHAKAETAAVKQRPKRGLGGGIPLSLRLHPSQGVR